MEGLTPHDVARAAVEAHPRGIAGVAGQIGYARSALSLYLAGRYPGGTARIEAAIMRLLVGRVACPLSAPDISVDECRAIRDRPMPSANPAEFRRWRTCQACPQGPRHSGKGGR